MAVNNGNFTNSPKNPGEILLLLINLNALNKDLPAVWKVDLFLLPLDLSQRGPKGFRLEHVYSYLFL